MAALKRVEEKSEDETEGNEKKAENFTIKYLNYGNLKTFPEEVLNESSIAKLYLKRNLLKTLVSIINFLYFLI